jgi:hypothetical protein
LHPQKLTSKEKLVSKKKKTGRNLTNRKRFNMIKRIKMDRAEKGNYTKILQYWPKGVCSHEAVRMGSTRGELMVPWLV